MSHLKFNDAGSDDFLRPISDQQSFHVTFWYSSLGTSAEVVLKKVPGTAHRGGLGPNSGPGLLAQSGPPNPVRNTLHHTINQWHILDIIISLFCYDK